MNERVPLSRFMPYGAPDLLVAERPNLALALVVASTTALAAFAMLHALPLARPADQVIPITPTCSLVPPPPLFHVTPAPAAGAAPRATVTHSAIGNVVPDAPETPALVSAQPDALGHSMGDPDATARDRVQLVPADPETLPPPGFQAVDALPRALRVVKPDYPEIAKQAQVEGWVLVHVLVGRDGRIVEVRLDERQHVPMLDAAALDGARAFVFEPATSNGRAVAAWVDVPFHFTLH